MEMAGDYINEKPFWTKNRLKRFFVFCGTKNDVFGTKTISIVRRDDMKSIFGYNLIINERKESIV